MEDGRLALLMDPMDRLVPSSTSISLKKISDPLLVNLDLDLLCIPPNGEFADSLASRSGSIAACGREWQLPPCPSNTRGVGLC